MKAMLSFFRKRKEMKIRKEIATIVLAATSEGVGITPPTQAVQEWAQWIVSGNIPGTTGK